MDDNTKTVAAQVDEFRSWLIERVAFYLDQSPETIDPAVELAEYGMDSVYAISVISDIEDRLHQELDMEEVRQHRTVDALVDHLARLTGGALGPAPSAEASS
ncbi:acyl carrier protein [Streptomyces mayteni]